jgi:hypothetical protein
MGTLATLVVKLVGDVGNFITNMDKAGTSANKTAGAIVDAIQGGAKVIGGAFDVITGDYSKMGDMLGMIPGPIGQIGKMAGDALGSIIEDTVEAAEGFRKLSAATGSSVEFLSGFTEVADDMRVDSETVAAGLEKFARGLGGIVEAGEGVSESTKGIAGALNKMDIALYDSTGSMRDMEQLIPQVADAFMRMPDGPNKTAIAVQLFGKKGAELIPILNLGSQAMKENMAAAKAMGLVYTDETVKAVDKLKASQDSIGDSFEGVKRSIGMGVLPELARLTGHLNENLQSTTQSGFGFETLKKNVESWVAVLTGASADTSTAKDIQITYHNAVADTVPNVDRLIEATKANSVSFVEYSEEAMNAATRDRELAQIVEETRAAHDRLRESVNLATAAYTASTDPLNALEAAQIAFKIATGQMTAEDLLQQQAKKELIQEYQNGILTLPQLTTQMIQLTNGTLGANDVLARGTPTAAGYRGEVTQIIGAANDAATAAQNLVTPLNNTNTAASNAAEAAARLKTKLGEIPSTVSTTLRIVLQSDIQSSADIWDAFYRAAGGPVEAGQPYIVGERGPEVFVPDVSGEIVPDLGSMSHTALPDDGETRQVTITQQFYGKADPAQVRDATADAIRSSGLMVVN